MSADLRATPVVADLPQLLRLLRESEPGRPRLTWYGSDGERVELSGRVLDNWVAKTANLLVDELDVGPGSRVLLHLPVHWRTATWLLAVWAVGACAVLPGSGSDAGAADVVVDVAVDVVVSDRPQQVTGILVAGAQLVVQPLPALSRGWAGDLPTGALDGTSEVRGQGDVFVSLSPPAGTDLALVVPGKADLAHEALFDEVRAVLAGTRWPARPRLLLEASGTHPTPTDPRSDPRSEPTSEPTSGDPAVDPVGWLLAPLAADGSVVMVGPREPGQQSPAAQEGVTARR